MLILAPVWMPWWVAVWSCGFVFRYLAACQPFFCTPCVPVVLQPSIAEEKIGGVDQLEHQ